MWLWVKQRKWCNRLPDARRNSSETRMYLSSGDCPTVRLVNRSGTVSEKNRPTPDPNWWRKKSHPHTKCRSPLKKNLCENNSLKFFFSFHGFFKTIPKIFGGSQKLRKKFRVCEKSQKIFFPAKSVHVHTRKPEFFPSTKKPHKTPKSPTWLR